VERNHEYILAWPRHLIFLPGQIINFFTKLVNFQACTVYLYIYILLIMCRRDPKKPERRPKKIKKTKDKTAPRAGSEIGPQPLIPDEIMAGNASYYHTLHSVLMFQPSGDLSS
jgi:hypothetical protein